MFSNQTKSRLCFISVAVLLLGSAYCLLWVLSSASLACAACNCDYALFAEQVRCRQPYIAALRQHCGSALKTRVSTVEA